MLTPHLIKHVKLTIDPKSKNNYIDQIAEYYIVLLTEFY